jgi:ABC-type transport system involved in multi-copper enzyme maturation permease subunit
MVGPVLSQEMLLGGRRGRAHIFRWLYAGWLLLQVSVLLLEYFAEWLTWGRLPSMLDLAQYSRLVVGLVIWQHFALLTLATPVLVAGAITDEKSRGTLQHLLSADLLPGEIVLGKLLGRSYQVLLLALPGLPLLCMLGPLAGIDPGGLAALACVTAAFVLALGAAALLASVWCRHTRDAVLGLLVAGLVGMLALRGLGGVLKAAGASDETVADVPAVHPLAVLGEAWMQDLPGERWRRLLPCFVTCGLVGGVCLALASWRLRPAYVRQLTAVRKPRAWWQARRPPVSDQPVRWKERHVEGIAPLAVLRRLPRWLGVLCVFVLASVASAGILFERLPPGVSGGDVWSMVWHLDVTGLADVAANLYPNRGLFIGQGVLVLCVTGLVLGIRCSGAITAEREKQTWEALLLTPISTRALIRGKLWGILGASVPYLLAYAVPALALSAVGGIDSMIAVLFLLGLTLLASYFVGSAGLWSSARARTSWRSLLGTLAFTWLAGGVLYMVSAFLALFLWVILMFLVFFLEWGLGRRSGRAGPTPVASLSGVFFVVVCVGLALGFFLFAFLLVRWAEARVANFERTRHWQEDVNRERRARRRWRG